jgi:putative endonuclease
MCYYVYLLQSEVDLTYYVGSSTNPDLRLVRHNSGGTRYTARKRPWKIVYVERHETKREALIRERFLKKQRNREFYERLIEGSAG